jgi:hypothetical protein
LPSLRHKNGCVVFFTTFFLLLYNVLLAGRRQEARGGSFQEAPSIPWIALSAPLNKALERGKLFLPARPLL